MRWTIHSSTSFEASHALTLYLGEPEAPHSHTWQVAIEVGADQLNEEGYAVDFHLVHRLLAEVTEDLHDADLNEHPQIGMPTPSAERVAEVIAEQLANRLTDLDATLVKVSVWEGPGNRVDLRP